jgi:general secretion pathway protein L
MNKLTVTDYRKSLQRLSQRLGLGRFLDWWLGELSAMVPRVLSGASQTTMEHRVLVEISGPDVTFFRVVAGKIVEAGRLEMTSLDAAGQALAFQSELNKIERQKAEIALCLPPEQVLRKKLSLPLAVEENLRQVIAFEMDRYTPFKAEQVYFDYRFVRRDRELEVSLAVAQRTEIDEPLRQLMAWGAQVTAVRVADDVTEDVPWDFLPAGQRQKIKDTWLSRRNLALASGAVVLLGLALALPIWQKRETVLALQPLLGKSYQSAARAESLRHQLEALMTEYNYLLDKKRDSPPVVAVLDDVTRVLPDDTWVQQFDLKGKEMLIQGETASSSKLAGLFEQAKTLHDASFRAPLTKGQGANSERFQLAAVTRPLPRAETEPQPPARLVVAQPVPGQMAAPGEKAAVAPAVQEKDKVAKPPSSTPETAKADSKPVVTKVETKPISAPVARTGNKP